MSYKENLMGLWKKPTRTSNGKVQQNIDIGQLTVRLKSIAKQGNIEIIQLAIQSILEELEEEQGAF